MFSIGVGGLGMTEWSMYEDDNCSDVVKLCIF